MDRPDAPLISVVMPTFCRPHLVARAVCSVQAQTLADWELIISDDEDSPGEAWAVIEALAGEDPRIVPVRNPGARGQAGNLNHAMSFARGRWIKPLYDDDRLLPHCLERMAEAARLEPDAVLIRCLIDRFRDDRLRKRGRTGRRPWLERMAPRHALLAVYLEDVEVGMPSQVMVRADVVRAGAVMEGDLRIGGDWWWNVRLLQAGALLMLNEVLVEEHQGPHETITSRVGEAVMYDELRDLRRRMHPLIDGDLAPPPPAVVQRMTTIMRGLVCARRGRLHAAAAQLAATADPQAWRLAARWMLRQWFPGRFERVPRATIAERPPHGGASAAKRRHAPIVRGQSVHDRARRMRALVARSTIV